MIQATLLAALIVTAADPNPEATTYARQAKAAAKQQAGAAQAKIAELSRSLANRGLGQDFRRQYEDQIKALREEIAELKTTPAVFPIPERMRAGDMGYYRFDCRVVSVDAAKGEAVLVPLLDLPNGRKNEKPMPKDMPAPLQATAKIIAGHEGWPFVLKGYTAEEIIPGARVKLPKSQGFVVRSAYLVEAVDMGAVQKKYAGK